MDDIKTKSRYLRTNMTKQERILWTFLRKRSINNLKFRRQYPIDCYIVDFICHEKSLIIEIDGGQHNENDNKFYDKKTEFLNKKGFTVLRFWNSYIDNNIAGVYSEILKYLE